MRNNITKKNGNCFKIYKGIKSGPGWKEDLSNIRYLPYIYV